MESTTAKAMRLRAKADALVSDIESGELDFCCDVSKNQALGKARKQFKRWDTWLADQELLNASEAGD